MHLVYFDESGNTGLDFDNSEQPVFYLGALIVPVSTWQALERDLVTSLAAHLPELASADEEVHATDIRNGSKACKGIKLERRLALRDDWLAIATRHQLKFAGQSVLKRAFKSWLPREWGHGIKVHPQIAAFPMLASCINTYLCEIASLGLFISDENEQVTRDIEKSLKTLRLADGPLRLSQVVEKGFFIDSKKSRVLQLCDLCTLYARKNSENEYAEVEAKPNDANGISAVQALTITSDRKKEAVLAWLKEQHAEKK